MPTSAHLPPQIAPILMLNDDTYAGFLFTIFLGDPPLLPARFIRWCEAWCRPGTRTATCRRTSPSPAGSSKRRRSGPPSSITSSTTTHSRTSRPGSSAPPPSPWGSSGPTPCLAASERYRCSWTAGRGDRRPRAPGVPRMDRIMRSSSSLIRTMPVYLLGNFLVEEKFLGGLKRERLRWKMMNYF